jgi:putative transposase
MPSEPYQSLAGFITSIPSRCPARDRVFADHNGVSDVTIYAWRKRFGKLEAVDVKRLRQLELENGRLKKLVAERDLDIEILKEVAVKKW